MAKIVRAEVGALIRENDRLKAENERLNAYLEYVAMMTDVELPEPEDFAKESIEEE